MTTRKSGWRIVDHPTRPSRFDNIPNSIGSVSSGSYHSFPSSHGTYDNTFPGFVPTGFTPSSKVGWLLIVGDPKGRLREVVPYVRDQFELDDEGRVVGQSRIGDPSIKEIFANVPLDGSFVLAVPVANPERLRALKRLLLQSLMSLP
jgi:hypothetical protein